MSSTLRKTINSIVCTGTLIRKELIENEYNGKEYRQLNVTVRYAPNMELHFYGRYNKVNASGEHSQMYDWVKEAFDKYNAHVSAIFMGTDSSGKYQWAETTFENADRVTCKAELEIRDRAYKNQRTQEVDIASNKHYKMNGKFGIVHASESDQEGARFTFEVLLTSKNKVKIGEEEVLMLNGYGIKEWFGDEKFIVYPLTIKVPEKGIEDTEDKLDNYSLKDGITALVRGKILCGKEMIKTGEDFDGEPILTSRTLDEFRLAQKLEEKTIYDFEAEDKNAIDPKEVKRLVANRNKILEDKKNNFGVQETFNGNSTVSQESEKDNSDDDTSWLD